MVAAKLLASSQAAEGAQTFGARVEAAGLAAESLAALG